MTVRSFAQIAGSFADRRNPDRVKTPRRNSYDIDDRRSQVFKPVRDGWDWVGSMMQAFDELLHHQRTNRYKGPDRLQDGDRRILWSFLKCSDFKTGQLDPSYQEIADRAGCHRATAVEACKRFGKWLGLKWVRRTVKAETAGQAGPQREQISNAFYFDLTSAPSRVWQAFKAAVKRRAIKKHGKAPQGLSKPSKAPDHAPLLEGLSALEKAVDLKERALVGSPDTTPV